jgi:hypothetical protein
MNQDDRGGNKKAAARGGMRLLRLLATAQDSYLVGRRHSYFKRKAAPALIVSQTEKKYAPRYVPYCLRIPSDTIGIRPRQLMENRRHDNTLVLDGGKTVHGPLAIYGGRERR